MVNYYRALVRGGGALRQARIGYPVIDVPTLYPVGRAGPRAHEGKRPTGRRILSLILLCRYLTDASHWVQQDQPDLVNEMLRAWLSGEAVPEASDPRF